MKHIICPICHEYTDSTSGHNLIMCNDLSVQAKVMHKFTYDVTSDDFSIIFVLRKKSVVCIGNRQFNNSYGVFYNRFKTSIHPFECCDSIDVINKLLKNKTFI